MQTGGRIQRVRLAELEITPLGMPEATPARAIARQLEKFRPPDGAIGPAQRDRHRLWHADDQR